ncbi:hypothetical protein WR25_14700 [Diploscapter pachys]|uniref:Beta-lactamase-related domain-containing protein n=1 Tax=Diploscapter pachys TaxID=2018661 RepID=A0A2A2KNQ1_9BILA|nr:hypothetical protein WR25_14700 [Diploscapter pachys]
MRSITNAGLCVLLAIFYNFASYRQNFLDGWESDGAAFAVYKDGQKVVDIWGGYADIHSDRKWQKDTMTVTFSTTKAVSSICIAKLVALGKLQYDDPVSMYWPGFGKFGRENVTVQMVLSHMSGLPYFDKLVTEEVAADHNKMRMLIESEDNKLEPGKVVGYHPYTFGWLVDQIVRHVDERRRGVGQYFREEIAKEHDIDFHIGLPPQEEYRMARISTPSHSYRASEILADFRVSKYLKSVWKLIKDTPFSRAINNPPWLQAVTRCTINNPDYHQLEQPAALGIGNARSLAKLFSKFSEGQIVNSSFVQSLQNHYTNDTDVLFEDVVAKGHGFFYLPSDRANTSYIIGHTGHGCQFVGYDLQNRLAFAYVTNGLKTGLYDLCRPYYALQTAMYDVIEDLQTIKLEQLTQS